MQTQCKPCPEPDWVPSGANSKQSTPWTGATSSDDCYATDQCVSGNHNCDEHADCVDQPDDNDVPTFTCKCKVGYEGSGAKGQCECKRTHCSRLYSQQSASDSASTTRCAS